MALHQNLLTQHSDPQKERELVLRITELESEIRKLKERKKYGLVWEDKPEDVVLQCRENVPVLKEFKSRRIQSNQDNLTNFLIEGDNYHSLSVLNYTHKNKIDVVYIDPPYNTGAADWIYNNDYVDSNDAYRHSKWVSMMKNRLSLVKGLMADSGLILCAIDHYELFTLGLLLDELFGEENRIGVVTVVHKPEGRNQEKFFGTSNEFMLIYAKNRNLAKFNKIILDEEIAETFDSSDENGKYKKKNFIRLADGKYATREAKPNFFYSIFVSRDLQDFSIKPKEGYEEVLPIIKNGVERTWKTLANSFMELVNTGNVLAERDINGKIVIYEKLRENQVIKTHWIKKEYHAYHFGTKIVDEILGTKKFDFPKSLHLLIDTLKLVSNEEAVILDFFAGSGTTGHAVLELNKQDGGNRRFIVCTNNENKICEEVTYERLKRVIRGYKTNKGKNAEGLGGNLSYYRTDLVNIEKLHRVSDDMKLKVTYQAGEMIAIREDTPTEIEKNDWWQIFEGNGKTTAIYFKEDKTKLSELVKQMEKRDGSVILYVFCWGKNEYKNEFGAKNIRIEDIPDPILEVYKEINRI